MCDEYLLNFHKNDLEKILDDGDVTKHFSIYINFIVLYEHQAAIAVDLLKAPEKCLEEWDNSTTKAQLALLKRAGEHATLKIHVHCRIHQLPGLPEVCRTIFPGNDDADKFLQVSGTVMRMSASKLLEYQRTYICVRCKHSTLVKAEYDRKYIIKQPKKCQNPEGCTGTNLIAFGELDSDNCKDYQEVKIQEDVKKLGLGYMPNTMCVTLEDDLVDSCKPGDNVTICGIVKRRWGEFSKGCKIEIDIVLKANNVQVNNSSSTVAATPETKQIFCAFWEKYSGNPLTGRDLILRSFCPQLYGLYLVKLAIAVVLAGGSRVDESELTGVRTRSESHLLLVGDPGTGKSHLLRFASKIIPRSVLTTGVGSTAAGLTVTAVMERGEWHLEGGALVLSDGGICCIDEFNSMKEHDRTSIHEAMEQQTISVAKASIVCKLNTRCSVLAACNPKGSLDVSQPLCMNVALPSPLLSRFDLILLLKDAVNEEWDTQIVDYVLNSGNKYSKLTDNSLWSVDILQSYFAIIRKLNPKLSEDAERILSEYYQMQRRIDSRNKARTTVRLLESLVRLSQGHARLMYHDLVETMDSIYAIALVDAAMDSDSSILDLNITSYSIFPDYPLRDYKDILQIVLTKLGLLDVLEKEMAILRTIAEDGPGENVKSRFFNKFGDVDTAEVAVEEFGENANGGNMESKEGKRPRSDESGMGEIKKIRTVEAMNAPSTSRIIEEVESRKIATDDEVVKEATKGNTKGEKKLTKVAKKAFGVTDEDLDFDFDEGYDTLSFGALNSTKDQSKKTKKDVGVRKSSTKPKNDVHQVISEGSSTKLHENKKEKENQPVEPPNVNTAEGVNEKVEETLKTVATEVKQSSVKNKLKKFKFLRKDIADNPLIDESGCRDASANKGVGESGVEKAVHSVETENFIKEDLKMLRMFPSVNDDFNVDLDFDWDNLDNATISKGFFDNKTKKKFGKKSSSSTFSNMSRSNSSSSQSRRNMFASDENVDDLDLNI